MNDLKFRPSAKLLIPVYLAAIALSILIEVYRKEGDPSLVYLHAIPAFLFLWTLVRHLALNFTTLTVGGGKLRYQSGVLSRSTRTMEIKKVQDVRVDQTLGQRMLGMGDISIETAVQRLPRWVVTTAWFLMACAIILTQGSSNAFIYFQF